jgi:hypothetical protein
VVARPHKRRGLAATVAAAAVAVVAFFALADRSGAYIYWANSDTAHPERIGRANNNGTHVDPKFIADAQSFPDAVTTDARHVYWVSSLDSIGRAKLNGKKVQPNFINHIDGYVNDLVASGGYIYWTNDDLHDSIGRARANGSGVEAHFIPLTDPKHVLRYDCPKEIAIAGDYLYWTNCYQRYAIGRARLDGSDLDREFVYVPRGDPYSEHLHNPFGLAATDSYVFWGDRGSDSIGRAATDGTDIEVRFIPNVGGVSTLAADDDHLFWPGSSGALMQADFDGTHVKALIKHGFGNAIGVFVDRLGP